MTIIHREMESGLKQMALEYPVVTLLGPRQSRKTTLVRCQKPYLNMESPDTRQLAEIDPKRMLAEYPASNQQKPTEII